MQKDQALEVLKQFKNDFAEQFGILRVGLFGSTVRNEATDNIDIDFYYKL